jgi:hypothetical protein
VLLSKWLYKLDKPSGQYFSLICDELLTCHHLNSNPGGFGGSAIICHVCVENHVSLSHGVQVTGATWQVAMRIVARVGD